MFSLWKYDETSQDYVQIDGNVAVDSTGKATKDGLTVGSYQLREVTAPAGFIKSEDPIAFSVSYDGTVTFADTDMVTYKSATSTFEIGNEPGVGTLEENASYTVNFTVWPDQDAYDYVTNLNNGIPGFTWNESTQQAVYKAGGTTLAYYRNGVSQYPDIVKYPDGKFAVMSNSYQTADYYIANTEDDGEGHTSTTYEKGDPIALDIPDPMVLTGSSFKVTKNWNDSLDPSQLAALIANAAAQGKTYGVTLNLKEDGNFYKAYTFTPVWNADTEKYEWPARDIYIAPALLVSDYPGGGTYRTVSIGGTDYYILNEGHEYVLEETEMDFHFEFSTQTYHPALVDGVLMNLDFEIGTDGKIVDGSTATPKGNVPLQTFEGDNTLRGGFNIIKKVVDENNHEVTDNTDLFDVEVTLTAPMKNGVPDFSHVENRTNNNGNVITQSVAWYRYYWHIHENTEAAATEDQLVEAGILTRTGEGSEATVTGEHYDGNGYFYLDFDDTTGVAKGTVKACNAYGLRIVNLPAGTTYSVTETETNGMEPSYEYWHDNAQSNEQIIIGNAASNVRITNKMVNRKVIVYKTDSGTPGTALEGAQFTINGTTLTSGANGYTAVIELPINATPYDLTETVTPEGYIPPSAPIKVTVSSTGVTYIQTDYAGGSPQTATLDANGNYVIHVRDTAGTVLPAAGGPGLLLVYLLGAMLVAAGGVVLARRSAG